MHITPEMVPEARLWLGSVTVATACAAAAFAAKGDIARRGILSFAGRAACATAAVLFIFQGLPHPAVGVSEVHLILGATLFLILGTGAAATGLGLGLLLQGLIFAPFDLPQFGMNLTTLLMPVLATATVAKRIIAPQTPYIDLSYRQVFALSATYQMGVIAWVSFWVFWGTGFSGVYGPETMQFGLAYAVVVVIEPVIDLFVLYAARRMIGAKGSIWVTRRLHAAEA